MAEAEAEALRTAAASSALLTPLRRPTADAATLTDGGAPDLALPDLSTPSAAGGSITRQRTHSSAPGSQLRRYADVQQSPATPGGAVRGGHTSPSQDQDLQVQSGNIRTCDGTCCVHVGKLQHCFLSCTPARAHAWYLCLLSRLSISTHPVCGEAELHGLKYCLDLHALLYPSIFSPYEWKLLSHLPPQLMMEHMEHD